MIPSRYQMKNMLEDVTPTVMSLKADVCVALGASTTVRFEICISEALTNVVKHAQPTTPDELIDVTVQETSDAISVEIFDPAGAVPFDLRDHAHDLETVDPLAESGRGLGLIMQCADAIDYGPTGDRNRLILTFIKAKQ